MKNSLILGFFDGVHLGHQAVIESALSCIDSLDYNSRLITFKNSPASFFSNNIEYIISREESIKKILSLGVNDVVELDFVKFANMEAEEYIQYLTKTFKPAYISTGFNHTFGANKKGNPQMLIDYQNKYNYKYICTEPQYFDNEIISSTRIKSLLKQGNIETANLLLNSNFSISGTVKKGAQLGRKLGFPTANIDYPNEIVKIPYGVYAAKVGNKPAIMNWGIRPTVNNIIQPIVEVHVLDYNGNLYKKNIQIEILAKIRDEKKFNSLDDLKEQINKDIEVCLKLS